MANALSILLNKSMREEGLQGVKICRTAPVISHLLFADDTLLFFKASRDQAEQVKASLDLYSSATGKV